jgi:hypothetical protein
MEDPITASSAALVFAGPYMYFTVAKPVTSDQLGGIVIV